MNYDVMIPMYLSIFLFHQSNAFNQVGTVTGHDYFCDTPGVGIYLLWFVHTFLWMIWLEHFLVFHFLSLMSLKCLLCFNFFIFFYFCVFSICKCSQAWHGQWNGLRKFWRKILIRVQKNHDSFGKMVWRVPCLVLLCQHR